MNYMKDHYCKEFNDKQICGTPQYLAPEVILRQSYGKTVDWWSMGIILYEFLTSFAPFSGNNPEDLFANVINGEIIWPDDDDELRIPDDAKELINGLLTHDPVNRLGADGAIEIKKHMFFLHLDWDNLLRNKAKFIPDLNGPDDTSYFDTRSDRYNHEEDISINFEKEDEDSDEKNSINMNQNITPRTSKQKNRSVTTPGEITNQTKLFNDSISICNPGNSYTDTDTDNEIFFASFSSYSSKFKIRSNTSSSANSPNFINENRQHSIHSDNFVVTNEITNEPIIKDGTTSSATLHPSKLTTTETSQLDKSTELVSKFKSGMHLESKTNQKSNNILQSADNILISKHIETDEEKISEIKKTEISPETLTTKSTTDLKQLQHQQPKSSESEQTAEPKPLTRENNTARHHRIIDTKSRNFIEQVVRTNQKNTNEKLSRSERNSLNTSLQAVSKSNFCVFIVCFFFKYFHVRINIE